MVYLLNAKLKRALNGEKEDENLDKENEDNIICSNCNLLRKEKTLLENKVQSLLDTIHQKDLEIAKLKEMLGLSDKADVMLKEKGKKKKHKTKKDKEKTDKDGKIKKGDKKDNKDKKNKNKDKKGNKESSESSSDEETSEENDKDDNSLFEEKDEKEKKVKSLYNKVKDKKTKK